MAGLKVLEYPYAYAAWHVDAADHRKIYSERKAFSSGRRAVETYRLSGVYEKAGLPVEVREITGEEYPQLEPYQAIPLSFADACREAVEQGEKLLIASGYCAFAPAIVGGIQQALGGKNRIGVVWIDAHSDNKIVEQTSSTDLRFVGFPLSAIMGQTMEAWRRDYCRMEVPCRGEDVLVSDARCSGEEGLLNLREGKARLVSELQFQDHTYWKQKVEELSQQVDTIFLMVDADILQSKWIPAYFRSEPGGHDTETVMENIRIVMRTGKVAAFACFCVDFDKYDQGGDLTYQSGMRLIEAGLEAWEVCGTSENGSNCRQDEETGTE